MTAPQLIKPRPEYQFPVGQTYVYGAAWRIFNAGIATLRMEKPVKDKGQIWSWYPDDAARVPLQMRARRSRGTFTFVLLRIEKK